MFIVASALLCLALAAPSSQGLPVEKVEAADEKSPTPPHTGFKALFTNIATDVKHLPSTESVVIAAVGGALAGGVHPFDNTVNVHLRNHYDAYNTFFAPGKYYGDTPEQIALSIGTWALGRVMNKPKLAHLGMDLLRVQAVTEILVEPIKFAVGRRRPDGSNYQSFPSGHSAITFATAAVLQRHLGWRNSLVAYGVASYVAASRLHDNRHYLSDVVFGAAVGSIAGRTVTEHGRDSWALVPTALPGGVAVSLTRTGF